MMAIWLLSIVTSVLSKLPDPELKDYYTLDDVNNIISSIATQNSSVTTVTELDNGLKYIRMNTKQYPDNTLPNILFIGSVHGGSPSATYTVLYYLDVLVNEYSTDKDVKYIVDNTQFIFFPVANKEAYVQVQQLYNQTGSLTTIWTGLEGSDWNCTSNTYAGINPDKNFPKNFIKGTDKCTDEGYTGDEALSSLTSDQISDILNAYSPGVIFNFDYKGGNIFYPLAGSYSNMTDEQNEYYDKVKDKKGDYQYMKYNSYGMKNGSLLDYANDKGSLIFEIWPSTNASTLNSTAGAFWDFIVLAVQYHNVKASAQLIEVKSKCEDRDDCEKYITFTINISSEHYLEYYCDINIDPGFSSSNVTFSGIVSYDQNLLNNDKVDRNLTECTVTSKKLSCTSVKISGFRMLSIKLNYTIPEDVDDDYEFSGKITASKGHYPFSELSYSNDDLEDESDESDDDDGGKDGGRRRKGVITGLVLLIVLLILLLIAGIILCCAQRNKVPEQSPQFSQGNVV